jgi:peptidoglycan hydrolase-like protein with peptidoglycan-binding domain
MTATKTLPTLSKGDTGPDVRWAQYRLVRQTLSYNDVDGVFGPVTDRAVRIFQESVDLDPDGVIGPLTWQALRGDGERPPTLKRGSSGRRGGPSAVGDEPGPRRIHPAGRKGTRGRR